MSDRHTLHPFEESLASLRDNILMMGSLAERNLTNAANGLIRRDQELCNNAIVDDEEIDILEKQIDSQGMEIITRFQPVASDLRVVVAAMRIGSNLERVADQAVSIARRARKLNQHPKIQESILIETMIQKTIALFKDSLRAFSDRNMDLALTLKERDREIDRINAEISGQFTDAIGFNLEQIRGYMNLIFIARNLERVGDHATNIAEDVVFAESAEDIRHSYKKPEN